MDSRPVRDRKSRPSPFGMGWASGRGKESDAWDGEGSHDSSPHSEDEEAGRRKSTAQKSEKRRRPRKSSKPASSKAWSQHVLGNIHSPATLLGMGGAERPRNRHSTRQKESSRRKRRSPKEERTWKSWAVMSTLALALIYLADFPNLLFGAGKTDATVSGHTALDQHQMQKHPVSVEVLPQTTSKEATRDGVSASQETLLPSKSDGGKEASRHEPAAVAKKVVSEDPDMVPEEKTPPPKHEHHAQGSHGGSSLGSGHKKSPMDRNMHELQVPADSGRLDEATVQSYYRKLAKAYLSSFSQGIYRHMFFDVLRRRTYSLTPPGANKGVQSMMFQIIDRKVYMMDPYEVPKNSKPFYRTRINEIIWLLSKLAQAGRVKNTEFMVSIHDCVQTVNKPHTYRGATYQESIPSFTIVACNFSDNIPFPMWEGDAKRGGGFAGWDEKMQEYATASQQPWENKEPRAVFRGGNRPSMFFRNKSEANSQCDEIGRTRLSYLGQEHPEEVDASVGGSCGGVHRYLQRMDEVQQQKFKYVVYAEGNCFWADRLNKQVFGPSMIIKQETPCGQFWEPLLKPLTHYVPTDFFFNNLVDQVKWARRNDAKVQDIVRNANDFANNFLTLKGISTYVEVLLNEYTALLVEPDVKVEPGAIEVTNKKV